MLNPGTFAKQTWVRVKLLNKLALIVTKSCLRAFLNQIDHERQKTKQEL